MKPEVLADAQAAMRRRGGLKAWRSSRICSGHTGAAVELAVCADLLNCGFEVFRNVSANGPIDVVAVSLIPPYDLPQVWKIQVKASIHAKLDEETAWNVTATINNGTVEYRMCQDGQIFQLERTPAGFIRGKRALKAEVQHANEKKMRKRCSRHSKTETN